MITFSFKVLDTHPSLSGHFEGNPIVPGAVIIDQIISGVLAKDSNIIVKSITHIKFLMPVTPNAEVIVNIDNKYKFECLTNSDKVANGQLDIDLN